MKIGMLWQNEDPGKELSEIVTEAALYYKTKYGWTPTLCHIHPDMLPEDQEDWPQVQIDGMTVELQSNTKTPINHCWLGVKS